MYSSPETIIIIECHYNAYTIVRPQKKRYYVPFKPRDGTPPPTGTKVSAKREGQRLVTVSSMYF